MIFGELASHKSRSLVIHPPGDMRANLLGMTILIVAQEEKGASTCRSCDALKFISTGLDAALHGNLGHAQHVGDFAFLEARGVILEGQQIRVLVHSEAAQTVSIGKLAQHAELFGAQRPWQFVGDFDEGHSPIIASAARMLEAQDR